MSQTAGASQTTGRVLRRRLATQRLSSPGLERPEEVVRLLTCVQCQEHGHALWSLGMRTRNATYAGVQAAFGAGRFLRTHILRPTWHYVAPQDLRWILEVTSPRVLSLQAGWHRRLGLDHETIGRGIDLLERALSGRNALTRGEIGRLTRPAGLPASGQMLGHLLLIAELRGAICSGPMKGAQHTYLLVDEVVPPAQAKSRDEALGELARRFFAGHGPAAVKDLTRWATLTQADARRGIEIAGDALQAMDVGGMQLWFDPSVPARAGGGRTAYLLPVYDEATLTYPALNFPALEGHPTAGEPDQWVGNVIVDLANAGTWKRTIGRRQVDIDLRLAPGVDAEQRRLVGQAADQLAAFLGLPRA